MKYDLVRITKANLAARRFKTIQKFCTSETFFFCSEILAASVAFAFFQFEIRERKKLSKVFFPNSEFSRRSKTLLLEFFFFLEIYLDSDRTTLEQIECPECFHY